MSVVKDFHCDHLRVRIFDTRESMGQCAGQEAADRVRALLETQPVVNVMFAAAPSQNEVLAAFKAAPGIDWSRINAFHMDEYVGLDSEHPAGFRNFLKRALFDDLPFGSVNLINGNADDPEQEAQRYAKLLKDHPLDVCLLGIGENGHIAFNDPPVADFADPQGVKIVELEQTCRLQQVHDGCFDSIDQVPTHALTVTIPALTAARYMYCSVPAATKAAAVERMVNGCISTECPATILRQHANACMYTDCDSGRLLLEEK